MSPELHRYVEFMQTIDRSVSAQLPDIVTPDIHFRDPFNDLRGIAAFEAVIAEMRESLDDLRIVVTHASMAEPLVQGEPSIAVLRWDLSGRMTAFKGRPWHVCGFSELAFASDGRVSRHFDYWDAAGGLYEQLPLIGGLCRWVRKRLALKS